MIKRNAGATVRELAANYPAVIITGPRQSGKTTLARASFPHKHYVSLEHLDTRQFAREDPRLFLDRYSSGAVLDEVQHTPHLFSYMQERLDTDPTPGKYVLTGSQRLGINSEITQSLAGRAAYLELLPFSMSEIRETIAEYSLDRVLFSGLYPPVYDRELDPAIWAQNYVRSYVERDVRKVLNIRDLDTFQRFLRLCAARTGQLLNFSGLASDAGITHNTAREWISVLQATYIVFLLRPHHSNFSKRVIKSPKLYFHDTGLAAWLINIEGETHMNISSMRGPLFENLIVSELLKTRYNTGRTSNLFFWRDRTGHEIDAVVQDGENLIPVEMKSGKTLVSDSFKTLKWWKELASQDLAYLIYGGDETYSRSAAEVVSWRNTEALESIQSIPD